MAVEAWQEIPDKFRLEVAKGYEGVFQGFGSEEPWKYWDRITLIIAHFGGIGSDKVGGEEAHRYGG